MAYMCEGSRTVNIYRFTVYFATSHAKVYNTYATPCPKCPRLQSAGSILEPRFSFMTQVYSVREWVFHH